MGNAPITVHPNKINLPRRVKREPDEERRRQREREREKDTYKCHRCYFWEREEEGDEAGTSEPARRKRVDTPRNPGEGIRRGQ